MILVIAEAGLELVPENISNHPSVINHARRRRKNPSKILLDRSYHHSAMKKIDLDWKRGRPDITHLTLLEALGTPLYQRGGLKIYIHTLQDLIVKVYSDLRLPRNYERFCGVFEQLLQDGMVPQTGRPLLKLERGDLESLVKLENPSKIIALTTIGKPKPLAELCKEMVDLPRPMFLVGGFQRGHFKRETIQLANFKYRVFKEHLETWAVASRLIYAYELAKNMFY